MVSADKDHSPTASKHFDLERMDTVNSAVSAPKQKISAEIKTKGKELMALLILSKTDCSVESMDKLLNKLYRSQAGVLGHARCLYEETTPEGGWGGITEPLRSLIENGCVGLSSFVPWPYPGFTMETDARFYADTLSITEKGRGELDSLLKYFAGADARSYAVPIDEIKRLLEDKSFLHRQVLSGVCHFSDIIGRGNGEINELQQLAIFLAIKRRPDVTLEELGRFAKGEIFSGTGNRYRGGQDNPDKIVSDEPVDIVMLLQLIDMGLVGVYGEEPTQRFRLTALGEAVFDEGQQRWKQKQTYERLTEDINLALSPTNLRAAGSVEA